MARKTDNIIKKLLDLQKDPQFLKEINLFIKKTTR